MKKNIVLLCGAAFLLCSCGTLFSSKQQSVSFDSNAKDVDIYINGEKRCTTPCLTKVSRSRDTLLVVAKKEGYDDKPMPVYPGVNFVSFLNIFTLTGFSTDLSTDYMWEYQPNAYYIIMEEVPATQAQRVQRNKENKIRKFTLENYSDIKADISFNNAKKEYVHALSSMTGLSHSKIEELAMRSHDEPSFTNEVIKEVRKK